MVGPAVKYFSNDLLMRVLGAAQLLFFFPLIQERVGAEAFVNYVTLIAVSMVIGRVGSIGLQDVLFRYLPRYGFRPLRNIFNASTVLILLLLSFSFALACYWLGWIASMFMVLVTINLHLSGMYKQLGDFNRFRVLSLSFYSGPILFFFALEASLFNALNYTLSDLLFFSSIVIIALPLVSVYSDVRKKIGKPIIFDFRNRKFIGIIAPVVVYGVYVEQGLRLVSALFFEVSEAADFLLHLHLASALVLYPLSVLNVTLQFYFGRRLRIKKDIEEFWKIFCSYSALSIIWLTLLILVFWIFQGEAWSRYSDTEFDFLLLSALLVNFSVVSVLGVLIDYLLFVDKSGLPKILATNTLIGSTILFLVFWIDSLLAWEKIALVASFGVLSNYYFLLRFRGASG